MNESPLKIVTGVKRKVITSYYLFCQKSSNNILCIPSDVGKRRFVECLKERKSCSGHSYAKLSEEIDLEHLKYKCNNSFVNWHKSCYASHTSKRKIFFFVAILHSCQPLMKQQNKMKQLRNEQHKLLLVLKYLVLISS